MSVGRCATQTACRTLMICTASRSTGTPQRTIAHAICLCCEQQMLPAAAPWRAASIRRLSACTSTSCLLAPRPPPTCHAPTFPLRPCREGLTIPAGSLQHAI